MFLQTAVSMIGEHRKQERKRCSQEIWWTKQLLHACRKRKSMKFLSYCMCIYWKQIQCLYFIFIFHFELGNIWSWECDSEITLHKIERHAKLPAPEVPQRSLSKASIWVNSRRDHIHWRSNWSRTGRFSKGVDICLPCKIMCEIRSWDGVAEVFLKAQPVSLNRAVQHCRVWILILWSKITYAWHSSACCHPPWTLRLLAGNSSSGTTV